MLQKHKATFLKEAKTNAAAALKNVLQKFGTEFLEFTDGLQLRNDDINTSTVCFLFT